MVRVRVDLKYKVASIYDFIKYNHIDNELNICTECAL